MRKDKKKISARKTDRRVPPVRCLVLAVLAVCLALMGGCTPVQEIKETYFVEGMAFDKGSTGYILTFQVFNPKSSAGGQSSGGSSGSTDFIVQSSGKTIYDAIRNATLKVGRKLNFSNTSVYIVSESLCKTQFRTLMDFMERAVEVRPSESLYVAKGSDAAGILTAKSEGEILSAEKIKEVIENYTTSSKILNLSIEDLYEAESGGTQDISLPAVEISTEASKDTYIALNNSAVFSRNRLAGYLNASETRGVLWVLGKVKGGILTVTPSSGGEISLEINRGTSSVKTVFRKGKPAVTVSIRLISDVAEIETQQNLNLSQSQLRELTDLQNREVRSEALSALNKCLRTYDTDIFGIGTGVFENHPNRWKDLGESTGWHALLKTLPVTVKVSSEIRYAGLIKGKVTRG